VGRFFQEEKGFALALVLLITTLVLVTVLEFNYEMRVDASISGNYRDELKALYVAKGGVNAAIALLRQDFRQDRENNIAVDSLNEDWAKPDLTVQIGDGIVTGRIIDESGKVNLNQFLKESDDGGGGTGSADNAETVEEQKMNVVKRILNNLAVTKNNTDEIIDSLMDWIGESSKDNPNIEAYYQSLPSPYESKGDALDDITELLLVKGIDKNLFYQIKEKSIEEEGEIGEEKKQQEPSKPLPDLFTVYAKGKININTAPKEVLLALHEDIDEESVNEIIERRAEEPFESVDEVKKISSNLEDIFKPKDGKKGIGNLIDVKSNYFKIVAHGTVNNVTKTIEAVVYRDSKPGGEGRILIKSWAEF